MSQRAREFFHVVDLDRALQLALDFEPVGLETVALPDAAGRVLADAIVAPMDLPGFRRSTMDGFAVRATSTFGASGSAPALLDVVGAIEMGQPGELQVGPGQAARILTGGHVPDSADAVIMVEHSEALDDRSILVSRAVAPGDNVIQADEDAACGQAVLAAGTSLRPGGIGMLAALGVQRVSVHRQPVVAILSTGDEVVPISEQPGPCQVRDVNAHTLSALVSQAGGLPLHLGIVRDDLHALDRACRAGLERSDCLILSGGSSVGTRDLTLEVLAGLPASQVLIHGVAIKPGKPTILARSDQRAIWGLPGHVASAMVVFEVLVRPFLERLGGRVPAPLRRPRVTARLARNLASAQGRTDFVRVVLEERDGQTWAVPLQGRSGLIRTMLGADGLVRIHRDSEGLDRDSEVSVELL